MSEVLVLATEPVQVDPETEYPNLGLYSFARGAFHKRSIDGAKTSARTLYRVRRGQFIYSRLFAFEGAYAVVPAEMDGYFVSNEYPTFDHDPKRILPSYLRWLFSVPRTWRDIAIGSKGMGDRRQRVHPERILAFKSSLPPLDEQRRIVAQLDSAAARTDQARSLRATIRIDTQSLIRALIFGPLDSPHPKLPFGRIAQQRPPDVAVEPDGNYQFAGVFCFGRGMFKGERRLGAEFSYTRLSRLRGGDFVYPKLMAWEGALAVVPDECEGCFVSPEFPVFDLDTEVLDPVVVDAYFRHPLVWPTLSGTSKGTNVRRRRLYPNNLLAHSIPIPPRDIQSAIKNLVRRFDPFSRQNHDEDLDALIPAMLHEVFDGRSEAA